VPTIALFGLVNSAFPAANSQKIAKGGWFPRTIGGVIASSIWCWRRGLSELRRRLQEMSMPVAAFLECIEDKLIGRPSGMAVWLATVEYGISPMLLRPAQPSRADDNAPDRWPRVPFHERHSSHEQPNHLDKVEIFDRRHSRLDDGITSGSVLCRHGRRHE
jgi:hypothetical protein